MDISDQIGKLTGRWKRDGNADGTRAKLDEVSNNEYDDRQSREFLPIAQEFAVRICQSAFRFGLDGCARLMKEFRQFAIGANRLAIYDQIVMAMGTTANRPKKLKGEAARSDCPDATTEFIMYLVARNERVFLDRLPSKVQEWDAA